MKLIKSAVTAGLLLAIVFIAGCVAPVNIVDDGDSQLKLRQMQVRYFDTADKNLTLRAVMATLQDLEFVIDKASYEVGTISATKLKGYVLRITVNVVPRSDERMMVRANAQYNIQPVQDPVLYQQFFEALSKSLFLEAHME